MISAGASIHLLSNPSSTPPKERRLLHRPHPPQRSRNLYLPATHNTHTTPPHSPAMALNSYFNNKIESMKLEIIERNSKLRRLEAQRNDYNSRGMPFP